MNYIIYEENKALKILDIAPKTITKGYEIARCDFVPNYNQENGEYLEVFNIQEHTETYTEKGIEKQRTYKTCELVVMVDNKLLKSLRLRQLKSWFNNEYRYYAEKFTRFIALDISEVIFDKFFGITYSNINDLYLKAESVRAEINNLETEI